MNKIIRDLKDVKALQIISMRLLKGFGYKVDDNVLKQAEDDYWERKKQAEEEDMKREGVDERKYKWSSFCRKIRNSFHDFAIYCSVV